MKERVDILFGAPFSPAQIIESAVADDAHDERIAVRARAVASYTAGELDEAVAHDVLGVCGVFDYAAGEREHTPGNAEINAVEGIRVAAAQRLQKFIELFQFRRLHLSSPAVRDGQNGKERITPNPLFFRIAFALYVLLWVLPTLSAESVIL